MHKWYFTGDHHFDHPFFAEKRGFSYVTAMDSHLIEMWNMTVPKSAVIITAGDFSLSSNLPYVLNIIKKLYGNIIFVKGNHDYWMKKAKIPFKRIYNKKLINEKTAKIKHIVVCHYPMRSWDRSRYGSWNLHGHCHGAIKPLKNQLDVGVDNAKILLGEYRPFSFEEVKNIIKINSKGEKNVN